MPLLEAESNPEFPRQVWCLHQHRDMKMCPDPPLSSPSCLPLCLLLGNCSDEPLACWTLTGALTLSLGPWSSLS